jgi:hypothetical protein
MSRGCRFISCCLPLGILCLSGCLIPYAYPNLSYVQGYDLGEEMPDCHVFRVDVAAHQEDIGESNQEYSVAEIARLHDGSFPPQFGITVNRGFYVVGVALNYNVGWVHATKVRLYRPGYQLIQLSPWETIDKIEWQTATTALEQEKAIDALLREPTVTRGAAVFKKIEKEAAQEMPDSVMGLSDFKKTELFAAAEYERVAGLAPSPADVARLRKKVEVLRNPKLRVPFEINTATATTPPTKSP